MNDSLEPLLADGIIDGILGQLKTGKEAEVWLVQHGDQVVAAKLYKERHARNFRNNVGYREGREVRNSRTRRAMEKGSRFGQAAAEEAWRSAEADSLYTLHAAGVRVPTPVMFYEGVLLMELVLGADGHPAPRLVEAPPATAEDARALYLDIRAQVVRMLSADLIHGDLSPYNILMAAAGPTLIDFPQTVAAARNNRAEFYFRRDLDNVRNFLAGFDPGLRGMGGDTGEIWNAYVRRDLTPDFAPSGTWREPPRRHGPPNRDGAHGPRDGRPRFSREHSQGQGRRPDFCSAPPPPSPPPPASDAPPVDAEEAELRALEALVLRQGGGERGKPQPLHAPRDGRKRRSPPGKPAPHAGGHGRPRSGEQRPGGAPPPQQGERRGPPHAAQHGRGQPGGNNAPGARAQGGANAPRHPGSGHPSSAAHGHAPDRGGPGGGHPRPPRNQPRGGPDRRHDGHGQRPTGAGANPDSNGRPPAASTRAPRLRGGSAPQVSYVSRPATPPKTHS